MCSVEQNRNVDSQIRDDDLVELESQVEECWREVCSPWGWQGGVVEELYLGGVDAEHFSGSIDQNNVQRVEGGLRGASDGA